MQNVQFFTEKPRDLLLKLPHYYLKLGSILNKINLSRTKTNRAETFKNDLLIIFIIFSYFTTSEVLQYLKKNMADQCIM